MLYLKFLSETNWNKIKIIKKGTAGNRTRDLLSNSKQLLNNNKRIKNNFVAKIFPQINFYSSKDFFPPNYRF
jgi:hypothetical protein